jgi:hypothetical protein
VRRSAFVVALASVVALVLAAQALALVVVRRDPDDFEVAPDVQTTTKRVFQEGDGSWRFRISTSGDVGPDYRMTVELDTRGGPAADFAMVATVVNEDVISCNVHRVGGPRIASNCHADAFRAWWGVARRDLDHTKPIRWRIVAKKTLQFGGAVTDVAPDNGWFV